MKKPGDFDIPEALLKWLVKIAGEGAVVGSSERLKGGMSSVIRRVTLETSEQKAEWVVRQLDNKEWLSNEPDLARHEAESLLMAVSAGLSAPKLIAYDEDGSQSGMPSVVMSLLEGAVVLEPQHMDAWLQGLAETLARIHAVEADEFGWSYFSYNDVNQVPEQTWSRVPEAWNQAIEYIRSRPVPAYKPCFIHRDYHPNNVLWKEGQVSGIVDWINACKGPAGVDIGHCRINLAMLHGAQQADRFLEHYIHAAGPHFQYDPYWDLRSLIDGLDGPPTVYVGWPALGVTGLTDELMANRLDEYVQRVLGRL